MNLIILCIISVCVQSSVRLQDGPNEQSGRVEICFNNVWGTICSNGFGAVDAGVLCRQLGYEQDGKLS